MNSATVYIVVENEIVDSLSPIEITSLLLAVKKKDLSLEWSRMQDCIFPQLHLSI